MDVEWVGIVAGTLTTCAFLPQVVKTFRSRSTGDLSWAWLMMMTTGVFLWMVFGYLRESPAVFVANIFTFICLLLLLYIKKTSGKSSAGSDPAEKDVMIQTVVKKRKVGKCFGCGQCEKGCPLIVEYREQIKVEKIPAE